MNDNTKRDETPLRQTRRQFLGSMGALAAAAVGGTALPAAVRAAQGAPAETRPNILFMLGDDWMYPHASCLGDPVVKTPTFDRLAREGVMFHQAYAAAPSCSPSRAAILTGQWHWRLGEGANLRGFIAQKIDVYPDLLEQAGYFVGLTGKGYGPGGLGDRTRNPAGPPFKDFAAFMTARPKGKPFCFWLGSHFPHRGYTWESGVQSGLDASKVKVPPYLPDSETVRKDICDYYFNVQQFDKEAGEALAALERAGELENTIIVMSGDNGWPFPRCKAGVYEFGTHQPLAIRWGAKVKGGREVQDFVSLSDLAPTYLAAAGLPIPPAMTARSLMPVLLSAKSGQVDPARDHVLCGMETHVPCRRQDDGTLAGYPTRSLHTQDYHFILNYCPDRWPCGDPQGFEKAGGQPAPFEQLEKETYAAYADCDAGPAKAWLLTHRDEPAVRPLFELFANKRPACELYDLKKDPCQLHNVAEDPAYAEVAKKLEAQLRAELVATRDPRAIGHAEELDKFNTAKSPVAAEGAGAGKKKKAKGAGKKGRKKAE